MGMELQSVHRVLKFRQKAWLAPYIERNSQGRQNATNAFEKSFFKALNNIYYGKSMQNVRNQHTTHICTDENKARHLISSFQCKEFKQVTNDVTTVIMRKKNVLFDKPIYIGFSVLELSKLTIYKWHYEAMPLIFPKQDYSINMQDTDSFMYTVQSEIPFDLYSNIENNIKYFDTSNFPASHRLYSLTNKLIPGLMKVETGDKFISESICLKPKMYAYRTFEGNNEPDKETCLAKGYSKKTINFDSYKAAYEYQGIQQNERIDCRSIRSFNHNVFCVSQSKIGLNSIDLKRSYINREESKPYGYH
jgi:hypothetical protein